MQHPNIDLRTNTDSASRILSATQFTFTAIGPATNPLSALNLRISPNASTENEKVSATTPVMTAFAPKMNDMGVGTRLDFTT